MSEWMDNILRHFCTSVYVYTHLQNDDKAKNLLRVFLMEHTLRVS